MSLAAQITLTFAALSTAGFVVRALLARLNVPPALSLMALGLLIGPSVANWFPEAWLEHRNTLSKVAFVVLLLRAGLAFTHTGLRPVILAALTFGSVPVAFEFLTLVGMARALEVFDRFSLAALAAFVTAAVSPAVILPTMLQHKDLGRGHERRVPDRIVGQTIVNAFIAQTGILIFLRVSEPNAPDGMLARALLWLPVQLAGGMALGRLVAALLRVERLLPSVDARRRAAQAAGPRLWFVTLLIIAIGSGVYFGCQYLSLESVFATLAVGFAMRPRVDAFERFIRQRLRSSWSVAEVVLFANLGSQIEIHQLRDYREVALLALIVALALSVRLGVAALLARGTRLTPTERRYTTVAHVPKATIQAVFGALPLATFSQRGQLDLVADGHTILILAVIAIVGTAPIGAVLLERWGARDLGPGSPGERDRVREQAPVSGNARSRAARRSRPSSRPQR